MISELEAKFPNAEFHMYIYTKEKENEIIEEINKTKDIYLFSSQGLKDQEITISEMMPKLHNIKVASGIG
jgi:UDP-N-acetyl-D-mannosaminuronic acid transferase (WecB/TagA/CpsF family)